MLDKILGSKTRLAIFRQLFVAERPVMRPRDLAAASELTCAPVCRELRKLKESGLIAAVTGQSYREISHRLIPVGNAIGREIIVKIQSREVFLSRRKSSAWHFLKHFEAKKMPCC